MSQATRYDADELKRLMYEDPSLYFGGTASNGYKTTGLFTARKHILCSLDTDVFPVRYRSAIRVANKYIVPPVSSDGLPPECLGVRCHLDRWWERLREVNEQIAANVDSTIDNDSDAESVLSEPMEQPNDVETAEVYKAEFKALVAKAVEDYMAAEAARMADCVCAHGGRIENS